jgi:hypothetical protein
MDPRELLMKFAADAAGTPVDLVNLIGTTPTNAGRNFLAAMKGERIPPPLEKLIQTGSSEDIRKRIGVGTEDSLGEVATMMAGPSVAAKMKALPLIALAFRGSQDSMLTREFVDMLKKGKTEHALDGARRQDDPFTSSDLVLQAVASKLSDKELKKYGTEEFALDKFLPSTRRGQANGDTIPGGVREVTMKERETKKTIESLLGLNQSRAEIVKGLNNPALSVSDKEALKKADDSIAAMMTGHSDFKEIEDLIDAKKAGKTLYRSEEVYTPQHEIGTALRQMVNKARDYEIPEGDIAKKSLVQLNDIIKAKEKEALAAMAKTEEAKLSTVTKRTEALKAKMDPKISETGWTQLTSHRDLANETDLLDHCLGACGQKPDGTYIPALDTVTGAKHKNFNDKSSFKAYASKLDAGTSEYYSFRPKGKPEFTVEVQKNASDYPNGIIVQAYGPKDRDLTPEEAAQLSTLAKIKGFDDETGYVQLGRPGIRDDAGNFDWEPDDVANAEFGQVQAEELLNGDLNPAAAWEWLRGQPGGNP